MKLITTSCKAAFMLLLACGVLYACSGTSGDEAALREKISGLKERIRQLEAVHPVQETVPGNIRHTVMFSLKHGPDAPETAKFLQDARRILTAIPVVENFRILRQVSPKNDFRFLFTMEFADENAYRTYNNHPDHVKFVKERWDTEVSAFLEADFIASTFPDRADGRAITPGNN